MKKDVRLRPPPRLPDLMWSAEHPNVAAREALQRGVDALGLSFAGTIKGELEAVHQFRIAVRRLRAVLQLFRPVLQQGWFNRYRAELRLLSRTIGAVRDCDVLWQNIIDASPELDPLLRDALAPVYDGLMERRRREHDEASAWLSAPCRRHPFARCCPNWFNRSSAPFNGRVQSLTSARAQARFIGCESKSSHCDILSKCWKAARAGGRTRRFGA
jgi:CHAD domain-containing protein